jgi:uracil-DNA glycosylase family 4
MIDQHIIDLWDKHNQEVIHCKKCPRLDAWREEVARVKRRAFLGESYWGKPVPAFGDLKASVLVVGLAPGAHGSNRTGRMFTGDASGDFLYAALHRAGLANQSFARDKQDGLILKDLMISAVCRCAPPGNKPTREEINNCLPFMQQEFDFLKPKGVVALGRVAFENLLNIYSRDLQIDLIQKAEFHHGAFYQFEKDSPWLLASYHPSRQNTQTGKLTGAMFDTIWSRVKYELLVSEK